MRQYSKRERIAAGVLAIAAFAPVGVLVVYLLVAFPDQRVLGTWMGAIGLWGGVIILGKIAVTGTSTRFLEQSASKALGVGPRNEPESRSRPNGEL